jgi:formamidopyrimidine-DNA glycosylase
VGRENEQERNSKTQITNFKQNPKKQNPKSKTETKQEEWIAVEPETLKDSFNRFIRLVFTLSNGKHLAFSDMRRFAKVFYFKTDEMEKIPDIKNLGPNPLDSKFDFKKFESRLKLKPSWKIKQVLMDQSIISGIGNIYSDEILFESGVHPKSKTGKIPSENLEKMFNMMKIILKKGIFLGGDSMSDYRNPLGEKGGFQKTHQAYRRTGENCPLKGCGGKIERQKIAGRSAHFCNRHQVLY